MVRGRGYESYPSEVWLVSKEQTESAADSERESSDSDQRIWEVSVIAERREEATISWREGDINRPKKKDKSKWTREFIGLAEKHAAEETWRNKVDAER